MALTELAVKNAKPREKDYKLTDEKSMHLLVAKNGGKYWRLRYRHPVTRKEKTYALGVYPDVSIKDARKKREAARKLIAEGIDPSQVKKDGKALLKVAYDNTFELVGREWYEKQLSGWAPSTAKKRLALLENDLFPWLGPRPMSEITAMDVLESLRRIEARGAQESARNAKQVSAQIFTYARLTQRCPGNHDPVKDLHGALKPQKVNNRPAIIEPSELAGLLERIHNYHGSHIVRSLLALCPMLFQRPGEMIAMEWSEINFEQSQWELPATKMKMRTAHIVPLPHQAIAILKDLQPLTGGGRYVFPNQRNHKGDHASDGTVNKALRKMGVDTKAVHCAHGFRSTARTMLDERLGFKLEWIEQQLAHQVRDALGTAYNRTKHLDQRKDMMQKWADYLDQLRLDPAFRDETAQGTIT